MRRTACFGLFLVLAGCVPAVPDNMRREAVAPLPPDTAPSTTAPIPMRVTPPALGYGGAPPPIPASGLGAEAPMPAPKASRMPTIGPGVPPATPTPSAAGGQSIMVPNGNGTTTIIHPDGTVETIPTPK